MFFYLDFLFLCIEGLLKVIMFLHQHLHLIDGVTQVFVGQESLKSNIIQEISHKHLNSHMCIKGNWIYENKIKLHSSLA